MRETSVMQANMLRAVQVGKARTSDEGPSSWMRPSRVAWSYDVAPDGAHFLMLRRAGGEAKAIVVHNWRRELREKLQQVKR
jgi:hypothetical protein